MPPKKKPVDPVAADRAGGHPVGHPHAAGGCEFCGDASHDLILNSRCHTTAPLQVSMSPEGIMTLRCYIPECAKIVAQFKIDPTWKPTRPS